MPTKRTLIADLGDDWLVPVVSVVAHPAVSKARWFALKSKEFPMTIAAKSLTQAMREANLSDRGLAEHSRISAASIARYRTGQIVPPASVAMRLAGALKAAGVQVQGAELLLAGLRELLDRPPSFAGKAQGQLLDLATGNGRSDVVTAIDTLTRIANETGAPEPFRTEVRALTTRLYTLVEGELASLDASTKSAIPRQIGTNRDSFGRRRKA